MVHVLHDYDEDRVKPALFQLFRWGQWAIDDDLRYRVAKGTELQLNLREQKNGSGWRKRRFFGHKTITTGVFKKVTPGDPAPYIKDSDERTVSLRVVQFKQLSRMITKEQFGQRRGKGIDDEQFDRVCVNVPYESIVGMYWGEERIGTSTGETTRPVPVFVLRMAAWVR